MATEETLSEDIVSHGVLVSLTKESLFQKTNFHIFLLCGTQYMPGTIVSAFCVLVYVPHNSP